MAQLLLEGSALRNVATIGNNGVNVGIIQHVRQNRLEKSPAAIGMPETRFQMNACAWRTVQHLDKFVPRMCSVFGMRQWYKCLAEQSVRFESEHRSATGALIEDYAVATEQSH